MQKGVSNGIHRTEKDVQLTCLSFKEQLYMFHVCIDSLSVAVEHLQLLSLASLPLIASWSIVGRKMQVYFHIKRAVKTSDKLNQNTLNTCAHTL